MRVRTQLKDIASFSKGAQINGDELVENGKYDYLNGGITPSGKWNEYNTPGGTVTISEGGNSCGYVNYMRNPFWCGAHCYYLFDTISDTEYLYYMLKSQQDRLMKIRTGACMPNIKKADLGSFELEYDTDVEKQQLVVSTLKRVEAIITARHSQLSALDDLIKARFVEMFGDPMTNAKGYELKKYGDVFELNAGGTPSKTHPEYWEGGTISWIGSNMCQDRYIYANDGKYITQKGYDNSSARLFPIDTVLVALVGATIGKTALLKFETTTNQNVLGIRGIRESGYLPEFVYYYTQGLYKKFIGISDGGFSMASKGFISELPIPVVPVALQEEFTSFADQVDKSKVAVQKALDGAQILFDSLMQQYFG